MLLHTDGDILEGMEDIFAENSGGFVEWALYNEPFEALAVLMEDGSIGMLPDNGEPYYLHGLSGMSMPGNHRVKAVVSDPEKGDIWLACGSGLVKVSPTVQDGLEMVPIDSMEVSALAPCGDFIILLTDTGLKGLLRDMNGETQECLPMPLYEDSQNIIPANELRHIYPLSSDRFLVYRSADSNSIGKIYYAEVDTCENICRASELSDIKIEARTTTGIFNPYEHAFHVAERGCYVAGVASALYVRETDKGNVMPQVIPYPQDSKTAGSWDGMTLWSAHGRSGVRKSILDEDKVAEAVTLRFEGPACLAATAMVYSPGYGMITVNHGIDHNFTNTSGSVPPLISAYSCGEWHNWGITHNVGSNTPDAVKNKIDTYPLCHPNGLAVDPLRPGIVYCGSVLGGLARFDLNRPGEPVLHMGNQQDPCASLPGFVKVADSHRLWGRHCKFSSPYFDSAGRLWSAYFNLDANSEGDEHAEFRVWTASGQTTAELALSDPSALEPWIKLRMPLLESASNYEIMYPLKGNGCDSYIFYCPNNYRSGIYVYDHRGTVEDTSDDRWTYLSELYDDMARDANFDYIYNVYEDKNGELWLATENGIFIVDTRGAFSDSGIRIRRPETKDSLTASGIFLENVKVNAICGDGHGRVWIGTADDGVWCLDPVGEIAEGHYTVHNSGLPSDCVYGLGYNPEEGTILVSTRVGFAEFVTLDKDFYGAGEISVFPRTVSADYEGYIHVKGLSKGHDRVALMDYSGNIVAEAVRHGCEANIALPAKDNEDEMNIFSGDYRIIDLMSGEQIGSVRILGEGVILN